MARRVRVSALLVVLVSVLALVIPLGASGRRSGAFLRVNQVGYATGRPMRAYLMSHRDETGARFTLRNSAGQPSHSAAVGRMSGAWGHFKVYPLDFVLSQGGTYTLAIDDRPEISPITLRVDSGDKLLASPLRNALRFFQNQRDGAGFIPSPVRTAAGHMNDAHARVYNPPDFSRRDLIKGDLDPTGTTVDVSGGWADAGDYLKFVETTTYVEAVMLVGVRDFPRQMSAASQTSDFTAEARFGLDWLQKMWDDRSQTLYYQVGIGSGNAGIEDDHSIWRLPQADDTYGGGDPRYRYIRNRPVFASGPPGSKLPPNMAGRLAADFALCFTVFHQTDPAYANQCLLAAEHVFDLADTSPNGLLTASPHEFYGETEWRDDMELGATELYLATRAGDLPASLPHRDPAFYLDKAANWAARYIHERRGFGDTLNVYDVSGLAHFELYRAIELARKPTLAVTQAALLADIKTKLDQAVVQSKRDPFGFGHPWSAGDTAAHGAGLSVMASEYARLTKSNAYAEYAARWMGNILGANAWGTSLIVGDGSVYPKCIHHQVANLVGSNDGQPPILEGALVEGPLKKPRSGAPKGSKACPADGADPFAEFNGNHATYRDDVRFYSTVEPAIDLTAPSMLMFALQMNERPE